LIGVVHRRQEPCEHGRADVRADESPGSGGPAPLDLQRSIGNQAVQRLRLTRQPAGSHAPPKDAKPEKFPWIGRITGTSSAALRKTPHKDPDDPHAGTLADLPEGEFIDVLGRTGGWLHVRATVNGKETEGYVSHELVAFNRYDIDPEAMATGLTMREAFVVLKRAETRRTSDAAYTPAGTEKAHIEAAIVTVKQEPKYHVDETTYRISFVQTPGKKIKVTTIQDFVLFIEAVEAQYPSASPKEVVSEVRQLWFSDQNWELLVASQGIKQGSQYVDIETAPNPIAEMFDMADLAPGDQGKVIATPIGDVNIGHVMAGIDARLSGFPAAYPKQFLAARGHDSGLAEFKYRALKDYSNSDPTMFTTFAGDLGQAYASYIFDRYERKDPRAALWLSVREYAKPEELLGDIHGYIAAAVSAETRAAGASPTGTGEAKASDIVRDMYLVDRSSGVTTAETSLENVAGKHGKELEEYIYNASMSFAEPWYAKLVAENSMELWAPGDLFDEYTRDFAQITDSHERTADPGDTLRGLVGDLLRMAGANRAR
jgi:hypothetical protein